VTIGIGTALDTLLNVMLLDYLSFITLLFSLYVVAGGIVVIGNFHGSILNNWHGDNGTTARSDGPSRRA
jgi:Putative citrate transport